jgi:hypothetical protein
MRAKLAACALAVMFTAACDHCGPDAGAVSEEVIGRCTDIRTALAGSSPHNAGGALAAACAPLFREAECRAAHEEFLDPPVEARAFTLFGRCRDAYCDRLTEPKPAACTTRREPRASELHEVWFELRHAIWTRELGAETTARIEKALAENGAKLLSAPAGAD